MTNKNNRTARIPSAEWDFSKIPPEDYSVVWEYEQYREIIKCSQNGDDLTPDLNAVGYVLTFRDLTFLKYGKRALPWNDVPDDFRDVLRDHYAPFAPSKRLKDSAKALLDLPLVHLGAYTDIDIKMIYDRVEATTSDPRSSIHVFEIRLLEGVDSKKTIVKAFGEWLDKQDFTSTLSVDALRDLPPLAEKLKKPSRAFDRWLARQLSPKTKAALKDYQGEGSDPDLLKQSLLQDLNKIIRSNSVFAKSRFVGVSLRKKVENMVSKYPPDRDLERLNRMLIEDAYPKEIAKLKTAGRTASLFPKLIDLAAYRLSREYSDDVVTDKIKKTYGDVRSSFSPETVNRSKRDTKKCLVARVRKFKADNKRDVSKAAEYLRSEKILQKIYDSAPLEADDPDLPHRIRTLLQYVQELKTQSDSAHRIRNLLQCLQELKTLLDSAPKTTSDSNP